MKTDLWFNIDERIPTESGWWLCLVGPSLGNDEMCVRYCYYNKMRKYWTDRESNFIQNATYNVVFWSTADPYRWYDELPVGWRKNGIQNTTPSPALVAAWANVEKAVEQYNIVKALANES